MYLKTNNQTIKVLSATNYKTRLLGLMGKKTIDYALLIPKCNAIHTFFMRTPIDIIALNQNNCIIAIKTNLKPWQLYKVKNKQSKTSILELPQNTGKNYQIGETITYQ